MIHEIRVINDVFSGDSVELVAGVESVKAMTKAVQDRLEFVQKQLKNLEEEELVLRHLVDRLSVIK